MTQFRMTAIEPGTAPSGLYEEVECLPALLASSCLLLLYPDGCTERRERLLA